MSDRRSASPPPKVYRACRGCVRSKTRCEGLTVGGCARCRRREVECSLAGLPGMEPPPEREDLPKRVEALESAYLDLLQKQLSSASSSTVPSIPSNPSLLPLPTPALSTYPMALPLQPLSSLPPPISYPRRSPDVKGFQKAMKMDPSTLMFDETASCAVDLHGFPDLIARGYMSSAQVDTSWQLFTHRFSAVCPLIPFLLTSRPRPTHPFVVLAAVVFVSNPLPEAAVPMIEESIMYALTGPVSVHVITALLILSFSPLLPGSDVHVPPTPLRLASLAYSIGCDMGLELRAARADDKMELRTLWESIKVRYSLLQLQYARCSSLPPFTRLPDHSSEHVRQCIDHLRKRIAVIETLRRFIHTLATAEVDAEAALVDIVELLAEWDGVQAQLPAATGDGQFDCLIACIKYCITLRFTFLTVIRPALEVPAKTLIERQSMTTMTLVTSSRALLAIAVDRLTLNQSIPASAMTILILCLATSRRIVISARDTGAPDIFDMASLTFAENHVAQMAGLPGRVLRDMWCTLDDKQGSVEPTGSFWDGIEFDWDLFNINALLPVEF